MQDKNYPETSKDFIRSTDKEVELVHWLVSYGRDNPSFCSNFLDGCVELLLIKRKLSKNQFNVLVSIWNHL